MTPLDVGKSLLVVLLNELPVFVGLRIRRLEEVMVLDFAVAHHHLEFLNPLIVVFKLGFVLLLTFGFPDQITLAVHVLVLRKRLRI